MTQLAPLVSSPLHLILLLATARAQMSKLLLPPHFNALTHQTCSLLSFKSRSFFPFHRQIRFQHSVFRPCCTPNRPPNFSTASKDEEGSNKIDGQPSPSLAQKPSPPVVDGQPGSKDGDYPTGEFEFQELKGWRSFLVRLRMLFAFPWERVRKGSVLHVKLRGQIVDQLQSRFSSIISLPQICENLTKAAYDPRISGVYVQIEPLNCGWAKVEEIRRHIINFKKSGKFIVGYVSVCGEKEYYLGCACGELYAPPSAYVGLYGLAVQASFLGGTETLTETSTFILPGKKRDAVESFINEGIYRVERLKEEGWIKDMHYDDEVKFSSKISMVLMLLKERLGQPKDKKLLTVDYRRYSRVRNWTLGLEQGKDQIAIIRASGSIRQTRGSLSLSRSGIVAEEFIEKIRTVRDSKKKYKAVVIRIDSPGGDALASDLMWREIRLLSSSIPVIASMSDVAASGGYYMAMAAGTIVAENLTLTGSIGVVTGRFSLNKLYERIGFNKEVISRGKYAELFAAEQRPLRPDETELFAKSAQNAYKQFRDKAAFSRSMTVDQMEEVAQGRVWTGGDAISLGLVDAIGGMSRAIAIAKQKANIPQDRQALAISFGKIVKSRMESYAFDLVVK
ncbi:hypothetical protein ACLOJK_035253 [Asimina triloba]